MCHYQSYVDYLWRQNENTHDIFKTYSKGFEDYLQVSIEIVFDPLGLIHSDHYFHGKAITRDVRPTVYLSVCAYVPTFQNLAKQNNFQVRLNDRY